MLSAMPTVVYSTSRVSHVGQDEAENNLTKSSKGQDGLFSLGWQPS